MSFERYMNDDCSIFNYSPCASILQSLQKFAEGKAGKTDLKYKNLKTP
jgi:hypothetical protein